MNQNDNNDKFYQDLSVMDFSLAAQKGGMSACCDIEIILPYIQHKRRIIEIGAGYGRVLNYLLQYGNQHHQVFAIERNAQLFDFLNQRFSGVAEVYRANLMDFQPMSKFDAVLWLWGGISDFSKPEQIEAVKSLAGILNHHGLLVTETLFYQEVLNNAGSEIGRSSQQARIVTKNGAEIEVYMPSSLEIVDYANKVGLAHKQRVHYQTPTGRNRVIDFFLKCD